MRLAERYVRWSDEGKNLFILVCVALFGALVSAVFIFLDNVGVLLGWLLGSVINIIAYVSMVKGSKSLLKSAREGSGKTASFAALFFLMRLFLYAAGLVLAAFCTFRWGTFEHGYCNLLALALAYMPTWITLVVVALIRGGKKQPEPAKLDKAAEIEKKKAELAKMQAELEALENQQKEGE